MKKYDLKTIVDYVNGNDIVDYDIDKLENDKHFMMDVIDFTNDKNMYNICPAIMKNDYKFILFMINKFNDDLSFITKITKEFCKVSNDIFEQIEVRLALCNIIKNKDYDLYQENYFLVESLYSIMRQEVLATTIDEPILGEGFCLIRYSFDFSDLALNYFAKNFIEEIFNKYVNLEEYLHEHYNTYQEFEKKGVKKFIIDVLNCYDETLASYVTCNIIVLDDLLKKLNRINKNWDWYNNNVNTKKYGMICDIVYDKLEESQTCHIISGIELLYHFAQKYNIVDEILEYNMSSREEYEEIIKKYPVNPDDMDFELLKIYYEIQKEIVQILKQKNPQEKDNYTKEEKTKVKTNTIIDFKTRRIKKVSTY